MGSIILFKDIGKCQYDWVKNGYITYVSLLLLKQLAIMNGNYKI